MQKEYSNGEITIVWKPNLCIHSAKCWKGLIEVFDPKKRPWVNPLGASTDKIKTQINECPSAALSYYINNEPKIKSNAMNSEKNESKNKPLVEVSVLKGGPLLITGEILLTNMDGSQIKKEGTNAFCRCGRSKHKPFCDGSHESVKFDD